MSLEQRHGPLPEWASRERSGDIAWIIENFSVFRPVAADAYAAQGRGALVVDVTARPTGVGHPFAYLSPAELERIRDADLQRMMREYNPEEEFVIVLLKPRDRMSMYRVNPTLLGPGQAPATKTL